MDKKARRKVEGHILTLEYRVSKAQRELKAAQRDYLFALGFSHRVSKGFIPVEYYYYKDEMFEDIDHALEYADEHI